MGYHHPQSVFDQEHLKKSSNDISMTTGAIRSLINSKQQLVKQDALRKEKTASKTVKVPMQQIADIDKPVERHATEKKPLEQHKTHKKHHRSHKHNHGKHKHRKKQKKESFTQKIKTKVHSLFHKEKLKQWNKDKLDESSITEDVKRPINLTAVVSRTNPRSNGQIKN